MDEAGLQVGGSFLLGVRILCALFALWAAFGSRNHLRALRACPGFAQAPARLMACLWLLGTPALTVLSQGPPLAPGSEN